jgi:hypothetical protein
MIRITTNDFEEIKWHIGDSPLPKIEEMFCIVASGAELELIKEKCQNEQTNSTLIRRFEDDARNILSAIGAAA